MSSFSFHLIHCSYKILLSIAMLKLLEVFWGLQEYKIWEAEQRVERGITEADREFARTNGCPVCHRLYIVGTESIHIIHVKLFLLGYYICCEISGG